MTWMQRCPILHESLVRSSQLLPGWWVGASHNTIILLHSAARVNCRLDGKKRLTRRASFLCHHLSRRVALEQVEGRPLNACSHGKCPLSGTAARSVVQCSVVLYEQATEISQQLLLLQADTRHHALQPAAVCRPPLHRDSWRMHPCWGQRHSHIPELICGFNSSNMEYEDQRGHGERLCKKIAKHVIWTGRILWIVVDRRRW